MMVLAPTSNRWEDCEVVRVRYLDHFRVGSSVGCGGRLSDVLVETREEIDENWMEVTGRVIREDDRWLVLMERWDNIQCEGIFMYVLKSAVIERVVLVEKEEARKSGGSDYETGH